jgi:hypothetical protein
MFMLKMLTFCPGIGVSAYVERLYDPPPEFGYRAADGVTGQGDSFGGDGYRGLGHRQPFG